jgi:hypothetical protein
MNAPSNTSPRQGPLGASLPAISAPILRVQTGTHHDPFEVLGVHAQPDGSTLIRAFLPAAEAVEVAGGRMTRVPGTDCFERLLPAGAAVEPHPLLRWQDKATGDWHTMQCPYSFAPQLGEMDLYLLGEGRHLEAWKVLGARLTTVDGVAGCLFAVWAPAVQRVSVVGDFNAWDGRRHPMRCRGTSGMWELFIPGSMPATPTNTRSSAATASWCGRPIPTRGRCFCARRPPAACPRTAPMPGRTATGSTPAPISTGSTGRSASTSCIPVPGGATTTAASMPGANSPPS